MESSFKIKVKCSVKGLVNDKNKISLPDQVGYIIFLTCLYIEHVIRTR